MAGVVVLRRKGWWAEACLLQACLWVFQWARWQVRLQ